MAVSFGMLGVVLMLDICFVLNYFVVRALRQWTNSQERRQMQRATLSTERAKRKKATQQPEGDLISDFVFAYFFSTVKMEAMSVRKFPGWKKIPWNFGVWSTTIFVTLSALLLSPELIVKHLGIPPITLDPDLCVAEAYEAGIETLRMDLLNQTNLLAAREQSRVMAELHAALINDTSLYGVPPYQCPSKGKVSGLKEDWSEITPFFPGYCQESLEAAWKAAEQRECYHEMCKCPTLPDNPMFQVLGLADKEFCGAEVCIDVPRACPKHTIDEQVNIEDYRWKQLDSAEVRRSNLTDLRRHTIDTLETLETSESTAAETTRKIMFQVDVASYIYIAYSCLALFFPSPLILFRVPYWIGIKRLLFGVQKPYFICCVVALWWGIEYFQTLWYSPDLRLFMINLRSGDPCYVDANYMSDRQSVLNKVCEELSPMAPQFAASVITITDVLYEVAIFRNSCNCKSPSYASAS
jgi:hypothetical protein